MLTTARTRIDRWLGQLLAAAGEGDSVGIVLLHAAVDQSQRTVKSWKLGDAVGNLEALVTEIDEVAEGDAEGLGGRQRYVVRALSKGREIGSLTLRYEQRPEDGPAVDSEPATAAGTIALLQRHAEGAMRMMVQSFGGVIESYKEQVTAQKALIADFQKQAAENFKLQEELASQKLERELVIAERGTNLQLTALREENKLKQDHMVWMQGLGKVLEMAPVLLHYLTKGQLGQDPEEIAAKKREPTDDRSLADVDEATMAEWRETMTPEQLAIIMERVRAAQDRPAAGPPRAAETSGLDDAGIAAAAQRFFEALCNRPAAFESLAMAYLGKTDYSALGTDQRAVIEDIAAETAVSNLGLAPRSLWAALLDKDPAVLLPLVEVLKAAQPWAQLAPARKVQLMSLVRRAFEGDGSAGGGSSSDS